MSMKDIPYIDYRFLGIESFIKTLEKNDSEFFLFEEDLSPLFKKYSAILNVNDDTVRTGILKREEARMFFAEFGVKLTKSYRAYLVFILDHHPTIEDLEYITEHLESIVQKDLDNVTLSTLVDTIKDGQQSQ